MNRKEYLEKFSRAVRWRLSASQAQDVIDDYMEMLSQSTSDAEIEKKWGNPYEAARLLGETKAYHAWLVVFALLTACLLLPVFWMFSSASATPYILAYAILIAGIGLCIYGFRPPLNQYALCPKKLIFSIILLCLIYLAVMAVLVVSIRWCVMVLDPNVCDGKTIVKIIKLWGLTATVAGMWGLFQARTRDYRWRALYVLGVVGLLMAVSVYKVLTGMDLESSLEKVFQTFVLDWCKYGAAGLMGAVLCLKKI